jgi:hypothetical protein
MDKIFPNVCTFQQWLYVTNHGFNTISLQHIGFDGSICMQFVCLMKV